VAGRIVFGVDVETASEDATGFARYGAALFRELGIPVTWFLTGKTLQRYPDAFREVEAAGGIELQAHTYDHILLKTVLMKVPKGKTIHGSTGWFFFRGGSLDEIDADLARCQDVFERVLGRRATGLTGPWGYYRGLGDRPDLLELVDRHGFRMLRTFARNEHDAQPVPLEWQPFFYTVQGFPHILELLVHDYQDDFYWEAFEDRREGESYADRLKSVARRVAGEDLTWSLCSHDHACATREGFDKKGRWFKEIAEYALHLGSRFLSATEFYSEMLARRGST
jgi:hypothetical protein